MNDALYSSSDRSGTPSSSPDLPPARGAWSLWLRAAAFAFVYFGCERLSYDLTDTQNSPVGFWLPSGLFLGVLLLAERRQWLLLVLAAGVGNLGYNYSSAPTWPLGYLLLAHFGNSLSAGAGALLMRRFVAERPALGSVREFAGLVVFGGLLSLPLSATVGALLMLAADPHADWAISWSYWYSSDLLGVLLLTPVLLAWQGGIRRPASWRPTARQAEVVGMLLGLGATLSLAHYFHWPQETELLFVALPFVLWATFRFGLRGVTVVIMVSTFLVQWFMAHGYGVRGEDSLSAAVRNVFPFFTKTCPPLKACAYFTA